jgi:prophage regulatory protein
MSELPTMMSLNEAAKVTSLSRTAIFKMRERGDFPRAVTLSEKRIGFVRTEVNEWISARIAAREQVPA